MKTTNYLLLLVLGLWSCSKPDPVVTPPVDDLEIKGVDMSFLPEVRSSGLDIKNADNVSEDMLTTLKNKGVNTIRLRLWHTPSDATSNLATVKALSQEVKSMGMKVLLTVHYSDTWADPGHQSKPSAWASLNLAQLQDSVFAYTQKVATEIQPEYIQIGNEINNGLLWPQGSTSSITQMKSLLAEGIAAVRQYSPNSKIIIHHAGFQNATWFFQNIATLDYDLIGVSYYPVWHGRDLEVMKTNLANLSSTYNKPIFIAETSYPFTLQWNDWTNNIIGDTTQILSAYPPTPQGQKDYLMELKTIVKSLPNGVGFCYWGGEWISLHGNTATNGSSYENQAFWDFNNKALIGLESYSSF